jgi:hypothetical protein
MKRLISAALALSLLGTTAALADPWRGGGNGYRGGHGYHDNYRRGRGDNGAGIALGVGLGLFALAAIAASNQNRDRYYGGYDYYDAPPPPPPPPRAYRGYDGW